MKVLEWRGGNDGRGNQLCGDVGREKGQAAITALPGKTRITSKKRNGASRAGWA